VDNRDGTRSVFSSANYEALRLQSRETIKDPKFYERFYALVERFADEEQRSSSAGRSSR
jgi:hypothetical protein